MLATAERLHAGWPPPAAPRAAASRTQGRSASWQRGPRSWMAAQQCPGCGKRVNADKCAASPPVQLPSRHPHLQRCALTRPRRTLMATSAPRASRSLTTASIVSTSGRSWALSRSSATPACAGPARLAAATETNPCITARLEGSAAFSTAAPRLAEQLMARLVAHAGRLTAPRGPLTEAAACDILPDEFDLDRKQSSCKLAPPCSARSAGQVRFLAAALLRPCCTYCVLLVARQPRLSSQFHS